LGLILARKWTAKGFLEKFYSLLEKANFKEIQIVEESKTFFHPTALDWWDSLWSHGTRAKLDQLTNEQIVKLRQNSLKKAANLDKGQGIAETLSVFYGIGKKD